MNLRPILFLNFILILASLDVYSQPKSAIISNQDFNIKYLEHLVKIGIDSVREAHNCQDLINDSILYLAAKHHADYMLRISKLTHYEDKNKNKTPFKRVQFYKGDFNLVGENVLFTHYLGRLKDKNNHNRYFFTYEQLANSIVTGWVNSPKHFENIIHANYKTTAVAISIDKASHQLYACQVFGGNPQDFVFTNNSALFPYSNGVDPTWLNVSSFENISAQLGNHKHPFKLKHGDTSSCNSVNRIFENQPPMSMLIDRGYFVLRIENAEFVEKLLMNKGDGFAVEIVTYTNYLCGNPDYYTVPSRRNGQCQLNGKILKPIYRNELRKGFRKRRKKKDISYLSYIFGADSVPFFQRSSHYKIAKYSSEYFEIRLGKVPKNSYNLWDYNLITIQDYKICRNDEFVVNCGKVQVNYEQVYLIPPIDTTAYSFNAAHKSLKYTIYYSRNSVKSEQKQILAFKKRLNGIHVLIDSIKVKGFSSVDGNMAQNKKLQESRAQSIIDILQENQLKTIKIEVETSDSWAHFNKNIRRYPKWSFLASIPRKEAQQKINQYYIDSLNFILQKERKSEIKLYYTIEVENNLQYYINSEIERLNKYIQKSGRAIELRKQYLKEFERLYAFIHWKVTEGKIDTSFLTQIVLPNYYFENIGMMEQFVIYSYQYPKLFAKNTLWKKSSKEIIKSLNSKDANELSSLFLYNICKIETDKLLSYPDLKIDQVQAEINRLEYCRQNYFKSDTIRKNITKLTINHSLLLLNNVFYKDKKKYKKRAVESIQFVFLQYYERGEMNAVKAIELARIAEYYNAHKVAIKIIEPFSENDLILAYIARLHYKQVDSYSANAYYEYLIVQSNIMDTDIWCNMFKMGCGISFQAFENEKLWKTHCNKCKQKNSYLLNIERGSKESKIR